MARIGLVDRIHAAAASIDMGRKGFATKGKAEEGRVFYEKGIAEALAAFKEASATDVAANTADPQTIILAEYAFLTQELEFCERSDKESLSSLTKALQNFDDAFRALKAVEKSGYKTAEETYPHDKKFRVGGGYPKDSFHFACGSHKTRIQNILRSPGIDPIEKSLLKQRLINLPVAKKAYSEKQKKALTKEK